MASCDDLIRQLKKKKKYPYISTQRFSNKIHLDPPRYCSFETFESHCTLFLFFVCDYRTEPLVRLLYFRDHKAHLIVLHFLKIGRRALCVHRYPKSVNAFQPASFCKSHFGVISFNSGTEEKYFDGFVDED